MVLYSAVSCLGLLSAASGQVDVLTANYDKNRTSANLSEPYLGPQTVSPDTFGKLAELPVSGQIYAQPLVATGMVMPGCPGGCDVVYVATMENQVYAFNASTLDPTPLWRKRLAAPLPVEVINFRVIDSYVGVLSTPVIDRGRGAIYLVAETYNGATRAPEFQLHALDLTTGAEILNGPVTVTATVAGTGPDAVNGRVTLNPMRQLQRPGLLAANGQVYLAFGSIYDREDYHGWILAYDRSDLRNQTAVFNTTPNGGYGGIWASGRGLVATAAGDLYVGVGNGDYDGMTNFGESFLRLSADLQVIDWFTPEEWRYLSDVDLDTASLGPMLIPSLDLLLGGDKNNNAYLIDRYNMGHLGLTGAPKPQIFPVVSWGGVFNAAVWDRPDGPIAYFVDEGTATLAYRITNGQIEPLPFSQTTLTSDYPWQGIAVSANGGDPGSGILWLAIGDHDTDGVPGTLLAFDASDLTNLLWTSEMNPDRDRLGGFAKFNTPTVANGLVFAPTFSDALAVYGLLSDPRAPGSTRTKRPPVSNKRKLY